MLYCEVSVMQAIHPSHNLVSHYLTYSHKLAVIL